MCTYYFILSWTGLLCIGDDWAHEERWVSADPLWQWWCQPGSHQHLSACRMYCVHHCWYSGETGLHQKAVSTGTWMACERTVNSGYTCHSSAKNLLYSHLLSISLKRLYRTMILHMFCMGLKLGFSHWGKNINWGCFRVEHRGRYLGLRGWKKLETGRNCITAWYALLTKFYLDEMDWECGIYR